MVIKLHILSKTYRTEHQKRIIISDEGTNKKKAQKVTKMSCLKTKKVSYKFD